MLSCCGPVLSQGEGRDFDSQRNWEAAPAGYSACMRAWRWFAPHQGATLARTYYGSPERLEKYGNAGRCSRLWEELEMGLQRRFAQGFKSRHGSHVGANHVALGG